MHRGLVSFLKGDHQWLAEEVLDLSCESQVFQMRVPTGLRSVSMPVSDKRESWRLFVQDNAQEGIVDVDLAVVLDKAQFPEFVHEKIDPRPRCANHFRQHFLRYFGEHLLSMARRAIARKQQKSARQPFLGGVGKLVD